MKLTLLLISTFFLLPASLFAQAVTAEFYSENKASNISQYPLQNGVLSTSGDTFQFGTENPVTIVNPIGLSLSGNLQLVGLLQFGTGLEAAVYNDEGDALLNKGLENLNSSDETIGFKLLNTGEFIIRDNVANFSFFDPAGSRVSTYSNIASTTGGEQTSEIAVTNKGTLKVVYNPVIRYQNGQGSRIALITGDNEGSEIYNSFDRVIISLSVSEINHTISVITQSSDGSRSLHWFDRFGNLLFEMDSDLDVEGFTMNSEASYITVFAGSRVQVYNTETLERLGSASSRSSIVQAAYFPENNLILILGGEINNQQIGNPDITAVDLQRRQIERVRLDESVMYMTPSDVTIESESNNSYRIDGINRPIRVTTQF